MTDTKKQKSPQALPCASDILTNFQAKAFAATMQQWYTACGRDLPWRHSKDPYAIWISEIMLQQTQVETVKPYFERFIQRFPTVQALSVADIEEVFKLWEGLGYYRRASHLHAAAQTLMEVYQGNFPESYDELMKLKGIGSYTASAISSIAFSKPHGVIDGNTLRIISRLFNRQDNIAKDRTKKLYQEIMDTLITHTDPSDFNQGMMDLGATLCTPKAPKCQQCPVREFCSAYKAGTVNLLPVNIKNTSKTDLYYITAILRHKDKYFLIQNKEGLLENLYGLPQYEVESPLSFEEQFFDEYGTAVRLLEYEKEFRHIFSHRVWHMSVYEGEISDEPDTHIRSQLYTWDELMQLPIPTAHKKILDTSIACRR